MSCESGSNQILALNVPSTDNTFGSVLDVSSLGGEKSIILSGLYSGQFTVYASQDGIGYVPILTFDAGSGVEQAKQTFNYVVKYLKVFRKANLISTVSITIAAQQSCDTNNFISLNTVLTGAEGPQTSSDLYSLVPPTGLNQQSTAICYGDFSGVIILEGSLDNTNFSPIGSLSDGQFAGGFSSSPALSDSPSPSLSPIIISEIVRYVRLRVGKNTFVRSAVKVTLGGSQNGDCLSSGGGGRTFANVAAVIAAGAEGDANNEAAVLLGYYNPNDGGGGELYWDSTSVTAPNNYTVFQVGTTSPGRWFRIFDRTLNVQAFGGIGDGVADDFQAIQNGIDLFGVTKNGGRLLFPKTANFYAVSDELRHRSYVELIGLGNSIEIKQTTERKSTLVLRADSGELTKPYCESIKFTSGSQYSDTVRIEALAAGRNVDQPTFYRCTFDGGLSSVNKLVTADPTTEFLTSALHGFLNDDRVMFTNGTSAANLPGGLSNRIEYFVINKTANTFQVSLTSGGAAVDITSTGSGSNYVAIVVGRVVMYPDRADIYLPTFMDCDNTGSIADFTNGASCGYIINKRTAFAGGCIEPRLRGGWVHWGRTGWLDNNSSGGSHEKPEFDSFSDLCGGGGTYIKCRPGATALLSTVRTEPVVNANDYTFDLVGCFNISINGMFDGLNGLMALGANTIFGFDGSTQDNIIGLPVALAARLKPGKGAASVASASKINLVFDGNTNVVTGVVAVDYISTAGWSAGSFALLIIQNGLTLNHNSGAPPAQSAPLFLAGGANLAVGAGGSILLFYDGSFWRQPL